MGTILCFHSVTAAEYPGESDVHLPLTAFVRGVGIARRVAEIVPLSELVRRHRQGRNTSGLVALTFDDAYAALSSGFREFISREAIPIAIFVVADAAAIGSTYWWDRIDDVFPRIPSDRWRAFEDACGLPDEYRRGQSPHYGPLRPLRQWLLYKHAGRWPDALEPALQDLEHDAGYRTRHRSMTFDELKDMAAIPHVELGVHTVSHPVLPLVSDSELQHEIAGGFELLRERFAAALPILSIPFGLYDERTLRAARSAGMIASLTLAGRRNGHASLSALSRICITRNDTAARFALRLLGVPEILRWCTGRQPTLYPDLPSAST